MKTTRHHFWTPLERTKTFPINITSQIPKLVISLHILLWRIFIVDLPNNLILFPESWESHVNIIIFLWVTIGHVTIPKCILIMAHKVERSRTPFMLFSFLIQVDLIIHLCHCPIISWEMCLKMVNPTIKRTLSMYAKFWVLIHVYFRIGGILWKCV